MQAVEWNLLQVPSTHETQGFEGVDRLSEGAGFI